jgi:hypothetical protein
LPKRTPPAAPRPIIKMSVLLIFFGIINLHRRESANKSFQ